ncbi:acyl-CoA dehydratase activase [Chloroflexota bacterium]
MFLGIDIGSINAKLALIDGEGQTAHLDVEKVTTGPRDAVVALMSRLSSKYSLDDIVCVGVSGSGKLSVPEDLNWLQCSSSLSIASGVLHSHPDARTIIMIGGQSSLVVELDDGLKKPWRVNSNPLCAAGTGRFIEQQAYRLGINLNDFSRIALEFKESPPRIAARCSVFAKTDLIHLQQKGVPLGAMLYSLCDSIARMVASFKRGEYKEPIYFVGGVAANEAIVRSVNEVISDRNKRKVKVAVPENYTYMEAVGAALLARSSGKASKVRLLSSEEVKQSYYEMPRLDEVSQINGWHGCEVDEPFVGYLGVDVGSTSTKAVVVDQTGKEVVAKNYLMTAGRPVDAIKDVFTNLYRDVGDNAKIAGVGVTGSGRYLVGSFVGADVIRNEITAQTRAAEDVDPDADIIEIGGQDSKLVIKRNGIVVDYQMNKACAAGTGSFIDELAEMLGVSVTSGEFASLAFKAKNTIDLGTRCAAFIGQAVSLAQHETIPIEVVVASLSGAVARNYLSKVVGNRNLGQKVILTGAVFYNDAVVSAFKQELPDKSIVVPEHKEVTGAIGAALLAKEEVEQNNLKSKFKGFKQVVDSQYKMTTFTCKTCDNNCTISRMDIPDEKPTFYGSRCDLFDSAVSHAKVTTLFDKREQMLFEDYSEEEGNGITVGVPRALGMYDYAPLVINFLNSLGVKVKLSNKTNRSTVEQAIQLSYTDSCLPIKLLHGHASSLKDEVDYILFPSAIRMGLKDGDENQKYTCPLVQAAPYIIKQVLNLGDKLLVPTIDFSMGDDDVIKNLIDVARKMGFSRIKGKKAALQGLRAQRRFEAEQIEIGQGILKELEQSGQLGVVVYARSYLSQDSGANLGIAEKLAQLGVMPIPLDFLPLDSIDVKQFSDRPYWYYESKHIAGAAITLKEPQLYGLMLTCFGCGPNSFVTNIVEDITDGKPLGHLEIDEHAAEAGLVTRLEAFVDTINGYHRYHKMDEVPHWNVDIRRALSAISASDKHILIPQMNKHAIMLGAAMRAFGVKARVLPEQDDRNLMYGNMVSSGKECLPYRVTIGDFMKFYYDNKDNGYDFSKIAGFMPSAYGPCRFGKYAVEQMRQLREIGFDLQLETTVSNAGYRDFGLGIAFERLAWKGIVAVDWLQRLLWRFRPYEKIAGTADGLFDNYMQQLEWRVESKLDVDDLLKDAAAGFRSIADPDLPRRPLVGVNGEIFLRTNRFSNCDLERECEKAGLEVIVSPMGEWLNYVTHRYIEDAVKFRNVKKLVRGQIKKRIQNSDERSVAHNIAGVFDVHDPSIKEVLDYSRHYLSSKCGSEAVLSIGTGIEWMENPHFAGVISVMPHGCMPGGIVAAMSEHFSAEYGKPWVNLTYDGFMENTNETKISNLAEILKYTSKDIGKAL